MNYLKIQADILKMLDKEDKRNRVLVGILKSGDVAVTLDGYALYKIPQDKFYLDINKIPGNQLKADLHFKFDTEEALKTNELKKVKKLTIVKIESAEGHTWVDEKLLKCFDKKCTFEISKNKPLRKPVKVFEGGVCVGIVLPVIVEE